MHFHLLTFSLLLSALDQSKYNATMCPEMIEQEQTPTGQNCCQHVSSWAFKRQWGKTEQILPINLVAFHTPLEISCVSLRIFVLKRKALQHPPQPATGISIMQRPQKQSPVPGGKHPTLMQSRHNWWIWPLPPDLHVQQPELYWLPLISTLSHMLAAALGVNSPLSDYLADMGYIFWLYWQMLLPLPSLVTATKQRRYKYVPWKAIPLEVKSWDRKK